MVLSQRLWSVVCRLWYPWQRNLWPMVGGFVKALISACNLRLPMGMLALTCIYDHNYCHFYFAVRFLQLRNYQMIMPRKM